jgi:N-methylhydantoinase A/oxoprolinase/acetone carboxylase beta subunit
MTYRIAVNTGGTFSDVGLTGDLTHDLLIAKALTTGERVFTGIAAALTQLAEQLDITLRTLLGQATIFTYGTTFSTNAIITNDIAKTAFLTTAGHPDTLVLREGGKLNPFDFRGRYPEPYIPRRLTFEIPERVSSEGEIIQKLDEAAVTTIAATLRRHGVEAVAVGLLWSTRLCSQAVAPRSDRRVVHHVLNLGHQIVLKLAFAAAARMGSQHDSGERDPDRRLRVRHTADALHPVVEPKDRRYDPSRYFAESRRIA